MNYIELVNNFWRKHEEDPFGTVAGFLYFHLLNVSNKQNWRNPFKRQNTKICADVGITNPTLKKARNELKQRGMIDFSSKGKGDSNVKYEIKNVNILHTSFSTSLHTPLHSPYDISKTDNKTETDTLEEAEIKRRRLDFEISEYLASQQPPEEKEKSSAKKENEIPLLEEACAMIIHESPGAWRNVIEHYLAKGLPWDTMNDDERAPYLERRSDLFKLFYEQKEDDYRKHYPTWTDMGKNFYWWALKQDKINKGKDGENGKIAANGANKTYTKHNATGSRDERNSGIAEIVAKSGEFLQQHNG